jgi:hypothetical protein
VTEVCHHIDLVLRHRAERVVDMVRAIAGLAGVAVSTEVRHDDLVLFCELEGNLMPGDVRLGMTVNQKKRVAFALGKNTNSSA